MNLAARSLRRAVLAGTVFVLVGALHFVYLGVFPDEDPAQARWVAVAPRESSWVTRYVESGSYWLGLSYAMSLAFAASALSRYRRERCCGARNLAIGGVTFSGFLSVVGCYLIGCCGSPMLAVYLNLFGAAFVPLAKPLVAALTAVSLAIAWFWMDRRSRLSRSGSISCGTGAIDSPDRSLTMAAVDDAPRRTDKLERGEAR